MAVKKFQKLLNRCVLRVALKEEAESEWHIVACLRQIVPNRWANVKKKIFHQMFVFTQGVTKVHVSDADCNCLAGV